MSPFVCSSVQARRWEWIVRWMAFGGHHDSYDGKSTIQSTSNEESMAAMLETLLASSHTVWEASTR